MKENQRIIKLFEDLYKGDPWIDANLVDTLKKFTATKYMKRLFSLLIIIENLIP